MPVIGAEISNWIVLAGFGALTFWASPTARLATRQEQFFRGKDVAGREPGFWMLTSSVLIAWIFAKSVQNAADLGKAFGLPGGVAYAAYWLSFIVAGIALYRLRLSGYRSIHEYMQHRFGTGAVWLFSAILLMRLWNEIWSNTIVMGQYFGPQGSNEYYIATWLITASVLAYILKGGLRSSILTDSIQMGMAAVVLMLILAVLLPAGNTQAMVTSGSWTLAGGVDLILVALIQCLSYPFHDPVMTDRAFVTQPRQMRRSFITAGVLGVLFILLFSFVGIYARVAEISGNSTLDTARYFGLPMLLLMNLMMLTSGMSTIDSTFTSMGKLIAVELFPGLKLDKIWVARVSMIVLGILGNLMVHLNPAVLSATTVSGTMMVGLTPIFLLSEWKRAGRASYYASVVAGLAFGRSLVLHAFSGTIGNGKYGNLLWVNAIEIVTCFALYLIAAWLWPASRAVALPPNDK